jgi:hypothetical protein
MKRIETKKATLNPSEERFIFSLSKQEHKYAYKSTQRCALMTNYLQALLWRRCFVAKIRDEWRALDIKVGANARRCVCYVEEYSVALRAGLLSLL